MSLTTAVFSLLQALLVFQPGALFHVLLLFLSAPTQFGEKFIGLLGQYWFKMT
jgi:hypothetical protein